MTDKTNRILLATINSLFQDQKYEDMASALVSAFSDDIVHESLAFKILREAQFPLSVHGGAVYAQSATSIAIKADEVAKPMQLCCRPAFEIGKPIALERFNSLVSAMRTSIDRMLLNLIRQTSFWIEEETPIMLFDEARAHFETGIFSMYCGSDFGTDFSYATRQVPRHRIENAAADGYDKILDTKEILFQCFPRSKSFGSIYLGAGPQNVVAPGLDPREFPAIKLEPARTYGDQSFGPAVSFSIVTDLMMAIEDPATFIVGRVR